MFKKILVISLMTSVLGGLLLCFSVGTRPDGQKVDDAEKKKRTVLIDVIATKDGECVKDLTREDLRLYEDGKEVGIESFELKSFLIKRQEVLDAQERLSLDANKNKLLVVLHDVSYWVKDMDRGAEQLINELASLAEKGIEIMILDLNFTTGLKLLEDYTDNPQRVRRALEKATKTIGIDKAFDEMWLDQPKVLGEEQSAIGQEFLEKGALQAYIDRESRRFEKAIGGIFAVCTMLKDSPGRKSVLLISDGLPDLSSANPATIHTKEGGSRAMLDAIHVRDREQKGDIRIFDPFNITDKEFTAGDDVIKEFIRFANAQNISVYTFDPGTFSSAQFSGTSAAYSSRDDVDLLKFQSEEKRRRIQNLRWISEDTAASIFSGAQKFERLGQEMHTDLSHHYQLTFTAGRKKPDDNQHKIEIKVKRPGVEVRFRKEYTDYSQEQAMKMQLVSAYYSPSVFRDLSFAGEFVPFMTESGEYEPWMSIALPTKSFFIDRFQGYTQKTYDLHFWITEKENRERGLRGKVGIPMNIDARFMDYVRKITFMNIHFKGPKLRFGLQEYNTVFALVDPETNTIGTWEAAISLPDFKGSKNGAIINSVLGTVGPNPQKGKRNFALAKTDGSLEYGEIKFFPQVTGFFSKQQGASVFLQIYFPSENKVEPRFHVVNQNRSFQPVAAKMVAESWNKKQKLWNCLFTLDLSPGRLGENVLKIVVPVQTDSALEKTLPFRLFN